MSPPEENASPARGPPPRGPRGRGRSRSRCRPGRGASGARPRSAVRGPPSPPAGPRRRAVPARGSGRRRSGRASLLLGSSAWRQWWQAGEVNGGLPAGNNCRRGLDGDPGGPILALEATDTLAGMTSALAEMTSGSGQGGRRMDTWGISGPQFLLLYVALAAVTVAVAVLARRRALAGRPGRPSRPPRPVRGRLPQRRERPGRHHRRHQPAPGRPADQHQPRGRRGPADHAGGPAGRGPPVEWATYQLVAAQPNRTLASVQAPSGASRRWPRSASGCAAAAWRQRPEQRARYRADRAVVRAPAGAGWPGWPPGRPTGARSGSGRPAGRHRGGGRRARPAAARRHRAGPAHPAAAPGRDPPAAGWGPPRPSWPWPWPCSGPGPVDRRRRDRPGPAGPRESGAFAGGHAGGDGGGGSCGGGGCGGGGDGG